jgi:hypothetical protein
MTGALLPARGQGHVSVFDLPVSAGGEVKIEYGRDADASHIYLAQSRWWRLLRQSASVRSRSCVDSG